MHLPHVPQPSAPLPPPPQAHAAGVADDVFCCARDADPSARAGAQMYAALSNDPQVLSAAAAFGGSGFGGRRLGVPPEQQAAAVNAAAREMLEQQVAASPALAALARVWSLAAVRRAGWRTSRAELVARVSAARCAAARPVYGRDLVAAATRGVHPTARCLVPVHALVPRGGAWRDAVTDPPDPAAAAVMTTADFEPPSCSQAAREAAALSTPMGAFGRFGSGSAGCGGSAYAGLAGAEGIGWWTGLRHGGWTEAGRERGGRVVGRCARRPMCQAAGRGCGGWP